VLLLDEPLNALDEATRDRLCELLRSVQRTYGVTTLHVTHHKAEARLLADKLLVIDRGRIESRPPADLASLDRECFSTNAP
jgi:iron(III) transport system ATP-binding protein